MNAEVLTVDAKSFDQTVVSRSKELPVVVDFWAPWCGPCRALSPILDKLAGEYAGRVLFVKINTDENQPLAGRLGVRGIPNVKAFLDGKVANEFTGVMPESAIRQFLDRLIPSPARKLLSAARECFSAGETAEAERSLVEAIAMEPDLYDCHILLSELLCDRAAWNDAEELLAKVPDRFHDAAAARVSARILQWRTGSELPSVETLSRELGQDPGNNSLRLKLGERLALERKPAEALAHLVEVVRQDRGEMRERARQAMLQIFMLCEDTDLIGRYRRELSAALN